MLARQLLNLSESVDQILLLVLYPDDMMLLLLLFLTSLMTAPHKWSLNILIVPWWLAAVQVIKARPLHISRRDLGQT